MTMKTLKRFNPQLLSVNPSDWIILSSYLALVYDKVANRLDNSVRLMGILKSVVNYSLIRERISFVEERGQYLSTNLNVFVDLDILKNVRKNIGDLGYSTTRIEEKLFTFSYLSFLSLSSLLVVLLTSSSLFISFLSCILICIFYVTVFIVYYIMESYDSFINVICFSYSSSLLHVSLF